MKKNLLYFIAAVIIVIVAILVGKQNITGINTAGGGVNLEKANAQQKDTTITNVVSFLELNSTTEENLAQVLTVGNWEHQQGIYYVGGDVAATVSTQFGICCPTYDARVGINLNNNKFEVKVGNFTRNGVKTAGFDPQFMNFCTLAGESASVSNAVQLSYTGKNTKVYVGHQGGDKFYTLNGNYYVGAEQTIKKVALSGGVNFTEQTTGYAALKWTTGNNVFTATANNLCAENQNFVLSYNHNNINVGKGVKMNVGGALWNQPEKSGIQMVTGFNKGRVNLFAQAGGYVQSTAFTPVIGLGMNYKL